MASRVVASDETYSCEGREGVLFLGVALVSEEGVGAVR